MSNDKTLDAMLKQTHQITNLSNAIEDLCEERTQWQRANAYSMATIAALMAENDNLRAELLKAPNAQMVAMIAEFELWLEDCLHGTKLASNFDPYEQSANYTTTHISEKFNQLKAKHLSNESETE